jgi:hypothetical protein
MKKNVVRKTSLDQSSEADDLRSKSPAELIGMVWQLTLNAWSFKDNLNAEPRLQRDVVVLTRRKG